MTQQSVTNISNQHYDLVSVLYHALNGAKTNDIYVHDAEQAQDQELAQFFNEVKQQEMNRADKARELLMKRLS